MPWLIRFCWKEEIIWMIKYLTTLSILSWKFNNEKLFINFWTSMFAYMLKSTNVETNDNSDLNIHTSWWRQASRPRDALRETFRLELPCNTETVSVFACQSRDCIQLSKTLKTTTYLVWHPTILQQEIHEYLEQFLLSEADSRSARQESPQVAWNVKVQYCIHDNLSLDAVLSQMNPVPTLTLYFLKLLHS